MTCEAREILQRKIHVLLNIRYKYTLFKYRLANYAAAGADAADAANVSFYVIRPQSKYLVKGRLHPPSIRNQDATLPGYDIFQIVEIYITFPRGVTYVRSFEASKGFSQFDCQ